jgi:hypothetical protein
VQRGKCYALPAQPDSNAHHSSGSNAPLNLHHILCNVANLPIHIRTSSTTLMPYYNCTPRMQANTNTALDQFFPDVQLHTVSGIVTLIKLSVVQLLLLGVVVDVMSIN